MIGYLNHKMRDKMKDKVFNKIIKKQFEFDKKVASVFDDMLSRSVPFYENVIDLISDLVIKNSKKNHIITDLGCSTATTLLEIHRKSDNSLKLIGIDNSSAMIKRAKQKNRAYKSDIELKQQDFLIEKIPKSNIILANYTMQFIRPIRRGNLIKKIYKSLKKDGIFIFSEKIISSNKKLNLQLIEQYLSFKKSQGYSDFEIIQKREALENVLVPYSEKENKKMVKKAGFSEIETIFRWANFATFIAIKDSK